MWIRYLVALLVVAPLMLGFGGSWVTTLVIAIAGFGLGRAAEAYANGAEPEQRARRVAGIVALSAVWLMAFGGLTTMWLMQREQAVADARERMVLPARIPPEVPAGPPVLVTVHPNGLEWSGERVTPEDVHSRLTELHAREPEATVGLRVSSDDVPYADVLVILEMVTDVGLKPAILP